MSQSNAVSLYGILMTASHKVLLRETRAILLQKCRLTSFTYYYYSNSYKQCLCWYGKFLTSRFSNIKFPWSVSGGQVISSEKVLADASITPYDTLFHARSPTKLESIQQLSHQRRVLGFFHSSLNNPAIVPCVNCIIARELIL